MEQLEDIIHLSCVRETKTAYLLKLIKTNLF